MSNFRALKKIHEYISISADLGFEERLVLLRLLLDVKKGRTRFKDDLSIILLRLRYGAKQRVPLEWSKIICVPDELSMSKDLVEPSIKPEIENFDGRNIKYLKKEKAKKEHVKVLML